MNRFELISTPEGWVATHISGQELGGVVILTLPIYVTPHIKNLNCKSARIHWSRRKSGHKIMIPKGAKVEMPKLRLVVQNKSGQIFIEKYSPVLVRSKVDSMIAGIAKTIERPKRHFRQLGRLY